MTTLQSKPVRLDGFRSHGEDWQTLTFPMASAAPPAHGGGAASADASPSSHDGGVGAAVSSSLPEGTDLWGLVVGDDSSIASGVADGLAQLQEQPGRLAAARLKALAELQAVLRHSSCGVEWDAPITVPTGDLVLVLQLALQRLS